MLKEEVKQGIKDEIEHLEELVTYTEKLLDKMMIDLDLKVSDDYDLFYTVALQHESYLLHIQDLESKLEED